MHRMSRAATAAIVAVLSMLPIMAPSPVTAQSATPTYSCETGMAASPMAGMAGMAMATPKAGPQPTMTGQSMEFDRLYIDMMIPHHQSIIALAQAAQDHLTDPRLKAMAESIIKDQSRQIEELRGYHDMFYGVPNPEPMDQAMMAQRIPGMGDMQQMAMLMDPQALVSAFCSAANPDLAFIDLTIPHHEMAIAASKMALSQATHEQIRQIAQNVIDAQQREVDELQAIRVELAGTATPAGS
jgi:uncharacterized protein (DUF305 family)